MNEEKRNQVFCKNLPKTTLRELDYYYYRVVLFFIYCFCFSVFFSKYLPHINEQQQQLNGKIFYFQAGPCTAQQPLTHICN
jgi:hypothetical protein